MLARRLLSVMASSILATMPIFSLSRPDFLGKTAASTFPCSSPYRIMPLGDSITAGKSSGVVDANQWTAYRRDLYSSLQAAGYTVDYVGSQTNGTHFNDFDPQHEGHGGWTDDQIAANIYNWLTDTPADIILLHIGTNGLESANGTSAADVENILDEIDRYENDNNIMIAIFVARIINRYPTMQRTTTFNDSVLAMMQSRADYGQTLFSVNQETGAGLVYKLYPNGDIYDDVHPYDNQAADDGYTKMANRWFTDLHAFLQQCQPNNPPQITNPPGNQIDSEGEIISLDINASDVDNDPLEFKAEGLPASLQIDASTGLISGSLGYSESAGSPYSVRVTVSDGKGGTDQLHFTWKVKDTNRAPHLEHPGNQANAEGDSINLEIRASDPDEGDLLTMVFSASGLPPGLSIQAGLTPGTAIIQGKMSYEGSFDSPYVVTLSVDDGHGSNHLKDELTFRWKVTNTNRPPQLVNPGTQVYTEGALVNLSVEGSDPDVQDILTYSAKNLPEGLAIDPASGVISGIIFTTASEASPYSVTVSVADDSSPVKKASVTFKFIVKDAVLLFLPAISH